MEGVPGNSKMNDVNFQHNQHQYFLETQTRFQSALKKFQSDIKMFNEFRDLLVVSYPNLRCQIPRMKSIARSTSAPSILLESSEKLDVSSQDELWNLLNAVRSKGKKLEQINVDATRTETKCVEEEEEDDVRKLRREKGEILNRIVKLEEDITRSHAFVEKLQKQFDDLTEIRNELQEHLLDESASKFHKDESVSDPVLIELLSTHDNNEGVSCGSITVTDIVCEINDRIKFRNNSTDKTIATQVDSADFQFGPNEMSVKIQREKLGSLDDALAFPKEIIKAKDIDTAKILAILGERSHVELQRHLIIAIIRNQILEKKHNQSQMNFDYLTKRFKQLSQMNSNLCKELTEQHKELHSARLKIMELMQLVPLTELEPEMKIKEKNPKSIPTMIPTSLSGRREISQAVLVPGTYTSTCQARPGTRESSKFKSRSYGEPHHSSYNLSNRHVIGTRETLSKSLSKGSEKSPRFFEKVTRTQETLKKRLGYSGQDGGNRFLENIRHSIETERHRTRSGSPISTGPSNHRSYNPNPTATGTEPKESSTSRKLFSWSNFLK